MTTIYLKYGTYDSGSINWSSHTMFLATKVYPKFYRKISTGTTLRGTRFVNKFYTLSGWEVTISANELTTTAKWTFILNFFKADAWQISFDGNTFTDVFFEDEEMQLTYIDEIKFLPEVKFLFYKKVKD